MNLCCEIISLTPSFRRVRSAYKLPSNRFNGFPDIPPYPPQLRLTRRRPPEGGTPNERAVPRASVMECGSRVRGVGAKDAAAFDAPSFPAVATRPVQSGVAPPFPPCHRSPQARHFQETIAEVRSSRRKEAPISAKPEPPYVGCYCITIDPDFGFRPSSFLSAFCFLLSAFP